MLRFPRVLIGFLIIYKMHILSQRDFVWAFINSAALFFCPSLGVSSGAETVEQFFGRLQKKYKWTNQGKMKAVLETLRQQEIKTTKVLKELWEDVKSELPLSMGMKIGLEEEMKHL